MSKLVRKSLIFEKTNTIFVLKNKTHIPHILKNQDLYEFFASKNMKFHYTKQFLGFQNKTKKKTEKSNKKAANSDYPSSSLFLK
jgi:hypothetical protein